MKTITEKKYINQMLPHLLPLRAKKLGIRQENKEEWKTLAKTIKEELLTRYSVATYSELLNDMSYKRKRAKNKDEENQHSHSEQIKSFDEVTNKIVDSIPNIPASKRKWIKKTRTELLEKFKKEEVEILRELLLQKIRIYHKMPFIVAGNIYFADIFLPDYKIIIEIVKDKSLKSTGINKDKKRLVDLNKTGNKLITVSYDKAKSRNFIHTLVYSIFQHSAI